MSDIPLMKLAKAYVNEHFSFLKGEEKIRFEDGFISGYQFAKEKPHGNSRYSTGCRCEVCKEARKLSMREYRARIKIDPQNIEFRLMKKASSK